MDLYRVTLTIYMVDQSDLPSLQKLIDVISEFGVTAVRIVEVEFLGERE